MIKRILAFRERIILAFFQTTKMLLKSSQHKCWNQFCVNCPLLCQTNFVSIAHCFIAKQTSKEFCRIFRCSCHQITQNLARSLSNLFSSQRASEKSRKNRQSLVCFGVILLVVAAVSTIFCRWLIEGLLMGFVSMVGVEFGHSCSVFSWV